MGGPAQKDSKAKGEGKNERGGGEAPETLRATDVYERLTEVWACENVDAQKAKIAEVFELDDGPGVCREALNLEYTFNALLYAHERRFSLKQTKWFHNLINTLRDAIKEPDSSLEEITNRLRTLLLDPLRPPPPKKLKSKSLVPEEEDKKSKVGSSKVVRGKKRVKTSKFKKKSSKKDFKKEDNEPKPEEAVPVTPPPLLTKEEAKGVIDYVKDTILTHFSLYKAVFSESVFEEDKKEVRYPVGKCPDGDEFDLGDAMECSPEEDEKRRKEKEDRINRLVEAYSKNAMAQMESMLKDNSSELLRKMSRFTSRLEELSRDPQANEGNKEEELSREGSPV
ncbi:hypothetical protein AAMO2058_000214500 [Amorphochlora amoebiformis]